MTKTERLAKVLELELGSRAVISAATELLASRDTTGQEFAELLQRRTAGISY